MSNFLNRIKAVLAAIRSTDAPRPKQIRTVGPNHTAPFGRGKCHACSASQRKRSARRHAAHAAKARR